MTKPIPIVISLFVLSVTFYSHSIEKPQSPYRILRSTPRDNFSKNDFEVMLIERGFYEPDWTFYTRKYISNPDGLGFTNEYIDNNSKEAIIDLASGLMWHQSGYRMLFYGEQVRNASDYINDLNNKKFVGYSNWRLPTLEEAMTLIERERNNDSLYIDPLFSKKQIAILTVDREKPFHSWVVSFYDGHCYSQENNGRGDVFARAVRSIDSSDYHDSPQKVKFRSVPLKNLSAKEVEQMLRRNNFFSKRCDWGRGFSNSFYLRKNFQVIYDSATGLTWERFASKDYVDYRQALTHVKGLNNQKFVGYSDWRLPTLEEAVSLIEREKKQNHLRIDPIFGFYGYQERMWTSDKENATKAWVIDFSTGLCTSTLISNFSSYVRAVRSSEGKISNDSTSNKNITVDYHEIVNANPSSSQKIFRSSPCKNLSVAEVLEMLTKYNFYSKGDLYSRSMVRYPNGSGFTNTFSLRKDGLVVVDNASHLMWQRSGSKSILYQRRFYRNGAQDYINDLNDQKFAGYGDWRLPTLEEAMTLVERERKNGILFIDAIFDKDILSMWTSDIDDSSKPWCVNLTYGSCATFGGGTCDVRAVRSLNNE